MNDIYDIMIIHCILYNKKGWELTMKLLLSDFVTSDSLGRKTILANKVSYANSLLRKLNVSEGTDVLDTEPRTLISIAKELIDGYAAVTDKEFINTISSTEALYILEGIMHRTRFTTIPAESLSLSTCRDILVCINEIRMNETTADYDSNTDDKIKDLKQVITLFEKEISDRNLFDDVKVYQAAIDILKNTKDQNELAFYVPYFSEGAVLADLKSNRWSDLEIQFIALLAGLLKDGNGQELCLIEDCDAGDDIEFNIPKENIEIYKAYGMASEVNQVAASIKEGEENVYGDVAIYYSTPEYLNYIRAVFDAERIPYVLTNGYPATELNLTQLMLSLIAAGRENYSYELLEKAALNPVMTFENITAEGMDSVYVNPISGYYDALKYGIGWGEQRYILYKESTYADADQSIKDIEADSENTDKDREKSIERQKGRKIFADFLIDFCDVFDESKGVDEILSGLWSFVSKYTYKKNCDKGKLSESIYTRCNELKFYDNEGRSLDDKLTLIEDFLKELTVEDEPQPGAVTVSALKGILVIERKDVYILGLSAGKLSVDTKQSPILLDEEKIRFVKSLGNSQNDRSSVVLAGRKNALRRKDIYRSLIAMKEGRVTFLYNDYDTNALRQSSPSVLLWEIADKLSMTEKDFREAVSYRIMNQDIYVDSKALRLAITPYGEKKRLEVEKNKAEYEKNLKEISISATGLQCFLSCPLQYFYQYVNNLRVYDQKVPSGYSWLTSFTKGNLCHYSMEKYFSEKLPPNPGFNGKVDEDRLREIVSECANEIEKVEPYISKTVRDREEKYYYEKMLAYLDTKLSTWNAEHPWNVIGCEIGFSGIKYIGTSKEKHHVCFLLNGSIDRMDGYLDDKNVLHLRIIDYKTGKKENKQKEVEEGVQIQHFLYGIAAIGYLKNEQEKLLSIFGAKEFSGYSFDVIGYEFPCEDKENYEFYVMNELTDCTLSGTLDELYIDFPENTRKLMDRILGAYQAEDLESIPADCDAVIDDFIENKLKVELEKKNTAIKKKAEKDNKVIRDEDLLSLQDVKMEYTLKDYCDDRYCKYMDICRRWVGGIVNDYDE